MAHLDSVAGSSLSCLEVGGSGIHQLLGDTANIDARATVSTAASHPIGVAVWPSLEYKNTAAMLCRTPCACDAA
eukprot:scaffold35022_cov33-Tisochrysis_lutea.AAC.6